MTNVPGREPEAGEQASDVVPAPSTERFVGDALAYTVGSAGFVVGRAIWNIVLSRTLGPAGRGVVAVFEVTGLLVPTVSVMGVDAAYLYHVGREPDRQRELATSAAAVALALSVLAGLALVVFRSDLVALQELRAVRFTVLIALLGLMQALATVWGSVLLAGGRVRLLSAAIGINPLAQPVLFLPLVAVLGAGFSAGVAASAAGTAIFLAVTTYLVTRLGLFAPRARPTWTAVRSLLATGGAHQLGAAAQLLTYRLDALLVASLAGARQAGLYAIAVAVAETLGHLPTAAGQLTYLRSSRVAGAGGAAEGPGLARYRVSVAVTSAGAAILAPSAYLLVPFVFGEGFAGAVGPLLLLLPGTVALAIWRIGSMDLAGLGLYRYRNVTAIMALALIVALDLALIPAYGAAGAAAASSVAYAAMTAVLLPRLLRVRRASLRDVLVIRREDVRNVRRGIRSGGG